MIALLYTVTILSGLFLIGVVLLQAGKGADMGAAFGGASSTVFGPSGGANVMTRITAVTAILWMGGSLMLAVVSAQDKSVFEDVPEPAPLAAPAPAPVLPGDSPLENALGTPAAVPAEPAPTALADGKADAPSAPAAAAPAAAPPAASAAPAAPAPAPSGGDKAEK